MDVLFFFWYTIMDFIKCQHSPFILSRPVVRDLVDDIIVVEDGEIVEAMRHCYEILKVAVEPSGAIGLAAVLSDSFRNNPAWKDSEHIGIIVSGGNLDLGILWDSLCKAEL
mgnify:CR=1 FL=1